MATITSLRRISAAELAECLLAGPPATKTLAIVDVREGDYIGGHIKGAMNFPYASLGATLPTLVRRLEDADTVVFHCALSQQRGPSAALQYLRALEGTQGQDGPARTPQKTVYVLDRGFVGWQEMHGEDERLTEGFRKEIWRDE